MKTLQIKPVNTYGTTDNSVTLSDPTTISKSDGTNTTTVDANIFYAEPAVVSPSAMTMPPQSFMGNSNSTMRRVVLVNTKSVTYDQIITLTLAYLGVEAA